MFRTGGNQILRRLHDQFAADVDCGEKNVVAGCLQDGGEFPLFDAGAATEADEGDLLLRDSGRDWGEGVAVNLGKIGVGVDGRVMEGDLFP
jgi:hypothetical protein